MTVNQQIALIDKRIDGVRMELFRRVGRFNTMSANSWQLAWDRHPDLYARQSGLFCQRGVLQQVRDAEAERAYRADQRRVRASYRMAA